MKKKILLALSFIAIMTLLFVISISAAEPVETWDISATGNDNVTAYLYADPNNEGMYTLTISGTGNMKNWDYGYTPWYSSYRSKITSVTIESGVTSIGDHAFHNCDSLTSIVIPESVTSIGDYVFSNCDSLTSIVIPEGVTSIGYEAFVFCSSLTSIVIPESVTSIGDRAFYGCDNLTSIEIPEGVTSIGYEAFSYCESLTSIMVAENNQAYKSIDGNLYTKDGKTLVQYAPGKKDTRFAIPEGVTTIGSSAFLSCSSLTSIVIPESVTTIDSTAFSNCKSLTSIVIPEGVTSIGDYAFSGCSSLTSIVIPEGVTSIGNHAFEGCDSLTSIVIPEGVTTIGDYAFRNCDSLTSIVIPESVTTIGDYAFHNCDSLTSITVAENNQAYKSIDGNLYTKDGKTLVQYAIGKTNTYFVIPEGVTAIGDYAFSGCSSLTSIVIPEGVTSIGDYAFVLCSSLTSIVIPESVTSIGDRAFYYCPSLTSIVIPESVTSIGDYAFYNCDSLTIYCEAESQPAGWHVDWNLSSCPVVWGYFDKESCLEDIFTFKGYSFGFAGQISFGFDIDYEALAKYEKKTGKTLEIGVVFAGYDNLGGKQPLDQNGNAITLDAGKVIKADLTDFNFLSYDFALFDIGDSIKDVKLVISAYIFDGESVKYVQENGISDTVTGISYNEAKESVKE